MKLMGMMAAVLAVTALAGCNKTPNEAAADNVAATAENQADTIEANAGNAADSMQATASNEADAVRAQGDNTADAIRNGNAAAPR
jgi:hypothetical protein